jgi:APA family basic amino acid/polyamine antiporter
MFSSATPFAQSKRVLDSVSSMTTSHKWWQLLFAKKSLADLDREAKKSTFNRQLGALQLTAINIGAIIGTGIFGKQNLNETTKKKSCISTFLTGVRFSLFFNPIVLTGVVAANNAGPAVILSFGIAAVAAGFAALCYAEIASLIPVSGR